MAAGDAQVMSGRFASAVPLNGMVCEVKTVGDAVRLLSVSTSVPLCVPPLVGLKVMGKAHGNPGGSVPGVAALAVTTAQSVAPVVFKVKLLSLMAGFVSCSR